MRPAAGKLTAAVRSRPLKAGVAATAAAAAAAAIGVGLASGSSPHTSHRVATGPPPSSTTTSTTSTLPPTTTTTIDTAPTGTPIVVPVGGLRFGSDSSAVLAVKRRLAQLRYDPGDQASARFDTPLYYAVVAFEKVHGLPRDGRVTQATANLMVADGLPKPLIAGAEPTRVEVDLARQVLLFWRSAKLALILPVSSGFGGHYCGQDGSCGIAVTPTGAYRATSKILGEHQSPLGFLWDPVFFNGGIAIHGEPSVPNTPASHGCVRIPMNDAMWMYDHLTLGIPVYVADATHIPVAFDRGGTIGQRQPGGTPPTLPRPTTTTTKPTVPSSTTSTTKPLRATTTTVPHG